MTENGNLVLLVTTEQSYLIVSLIDKLAGHRIRTLSFNARNASASLSKEKADMIMIYVDQMPISKEVLIFCGTRLIWKISRSLCSGINIILKKSLKSFLPT